MPDGKGAKVPAQTLEIIRRERDTEWTRILGIKEGVLTPEEAAAWLAHDRIIRARNVTAARPRRGPIHW